MPENLVLRVHKSAIVTSNVVKVQPSAMEKLKELQRASGLAASQIVSQMILFYADKVEINEV